MPPDESLDSLALCIALRTRRLSRLITRRYDHGLRETGLTVAQFILLGMVALNQPVSPTSLGRMLDLEKSTLSRTLRPLIESKFLISEAASAGGQSLRITRKGHEQLRRALPAWKEAQREVLAMLGGDAVSQLDQMIAAIAKRE